MNSEQIREENRRKNPDVAFIVDSLRAAGLDCTVKYVGKIRPETEADLLWFARKKAADEASQP